MNHFKKGGHVAVEVRHIGAVGAPIMIIDNFVAEPALLRELAKDAFFIDVGPTYPGVRAPAPTGYSEFVMATYAQDIHQIFRGQVPSRFDICTYSMVTTPAQKLSYRQSIPHFDGTEPKRLAFLHYLVDETFGGTSFYRHRSTGVEIVTDENKPTYLAALGQQREDWDQGPAGYINGDTAFFERIGSVPARFNRAVFYPGALLHSGDVNPGSVSDDPSQGRLTLNGFVVLDDG